MSGTKSITGIALSNTKLAPNAAAGTECGIITITTGDGTAFSGALQLSGPYATYFTVTATRDPYTIASVTLSNAALASSPPVGTVVGTISVALSDGTAFGGTLSISDTTHFTLVGNQLRTASSLTNGTTYPLTITATDLASTNDTLTHNYSIAVAAAAQTPGPLTSLASPSQTTTTITVTWAPPTTGGALDTGVHQVQYKRSTSSTWLAAAPAPYCTPGVGSITDAYGNTWSLTAAGRPVINTTITNDPSVIAVLYLVGGVIWQWAQANAWWKVTTTGVLGAAPTWQQSSITGLSLVIPGLVVSALYNVRGYATNSAGGNDASASAAINVSTTATTTTSAPAQAAAVGYTLRTQGPNVTINQNIFVYSPGVVQQADGSIRDNGPTDGNYHYNDHFGPGYKQANGDWFGTAFGGGGYFEIDLKIEGNIIGWRQPVQSGWPAWWSEALEGYVNGFPNTLPYNQHVEYDAAEWLPASNNDYSAGIIHWSDAQQPDPWTFNNSYLGMDSGVHVASGFTGRHKYGWLWVPATPTSQGYIKNYVDNVQVGLTYTWTPYTGGNKAQDPGDPPWSVMDQHHRRLLVGTNLENPMTVYSISVWQRDDSQNVRRGVALPTG